MRPGFYLIWQVVWHVAKSSKRSWYRGREAAVIGSSVSAACRGDPRFAGQKDRDGGKHQNDPDNGKSVAESDHQGLALDCVAQRDERPMPRIVRVGDAMGHDVVGQLRDAVANLLATKIYR